MKEGRRRRRQGSDLFIELEDDVKRIADNVQQLMPQLGSVSSEMLVAAHLKDRQVEGGHWGRGGDLGEIEEGHGEEDGSGEDVLRKEGWGREGTDPKEPGLQ